MQYKHFFTCKRVWAKQASLRSTLSLTDTSQISCPLALSNTSNFLTGEEKLVPQPLINGEGFLPGWWYFSPCYTGFNFTALNFNKSTTLTLSCTESTSLVEVSSCSLACWWVFISAFSCDCSSWTRFYFFLKIFSHFLHK